MKLNLNLLQNWKTRKTSSRAETLKINKATESWWPLREGVIDPRNLLTNQVHGSKYQQVKTGTTGNLLSVCGHKPLSLFKAAAGAIFFYNFFTNQQNSAVKKNPGEFDLGALGCRNVV